MLEMIVRTVDHDAKHGSPVAMLLPRGLAACPPLALPIQPADACTLSHEIEGQATPRGRAYALLAESLAAIGGYVAAIVLAPGSDGDPIARLRVRLPSGWIEQETDVTSALGLAVHTSLPLLVSERLTHRPATPDTRDEDRPPVTPEQPATVPVPFLRALDEA